MKAQQLHNDPKTWVLVLSTGEEVSEQLLAFARKHTPGCASFTALGAFERSMLGYFDWQQKKYLENSVEEQVEVLSLVGNLTWSEKNEPKLHMHVVVGMRDGQARGGHILKATVRPTLEVALVESPVYLQRQYDPQSHIPLIHPGGRTAGSMGHAPHAKK